MILFASLMLHFSLACSRAASPPPTCYTTLCYHTTKHSSTSARAVQSSTITRSLNRIEKREEEKKKDAVQENGLCFRERGDRKRIVNKGPREGCGKPLDMTN
ncbi:hypothetical protein HOY80DRAFT_969586 [Tuber brumale]|nr:hypothetical protein HOY80DRAFT_969586 [Tuber brumale]